MKRSRHNAGQVPRLKELSRIVFIPNGQPDTAKNGFATGANKARITANNLPLSASRQDNPNGAEVLNAQPQPKFSIQLPGTDTGMASTCTFV